MRPGKNTKPIMKSMSFPKMMERTESLILEPVDDDGDVLRIDRNGKFIFNFDTREISTPYVSKSGDEVTYKTEILRFGEWKPYAMHRLVALTFCSRTPERGIVHHIDCDRSHNGANNLLWVTHKEHGALHRLLNSGEKEEYATLVARIQRENEEYEANYLEA